MGENEIEKKLPTFERLVISKATLIIIMIISFCGCSTSMKDHSRFLNQATGTKKTISLIKTIFYFLPNIKVEYPTCI